MEKMGQAKQYVPIFVGSTYEDMKDYRVAVRETLHRLETTVRGMEYFGSKPRSPKQECLKAVRSCLAYIGIFGMRYGSIDEETGKSMTHIEYEEAQRLRLPTLIYLIDEEKQPVLPKFFDTGDNAEKLVNLKDELKKRFTVSFFTTPDDLAKRISQDLPPILESIGVEIQKREENSIDIKQLVKRFEMRPRRYSGMDVIINGVVRDEIEDVSSDNCDALNLKLGEAIKRKIDFPLLNDTKWVYAEDKMADWLESVEEDTKQKMRIRLIFGKITERNWDYGYNTFIIKGYKLIELLEEVKAHATSANKT